MHAFNNHFVFITVVWYMTRKGEDMKRPILDISLFLSHFFSKLTYNASLFYFITQVYICIEGGVIINSFQYV